MFRRFLRLLHKTTKQYHNLTFIKNEEHAIIVTSTLYSLNSYSSSRINFTNFFDTRS